MTWLLQWFHLAATNCATKPGLLPNLYDGITCDAHGVPQITSVQAGLVVFGNLVRILIALSGALAVIFIIVGAIYYVISMGDPGRIKQARDILVNTVIGLMVILLSYAAITFITHGFA